VSKDNFSHINKFEFPSINSDRITPFIERWKNTKGSGAELADFQSFLVELCELLSVPRPDPKSDATKDNEYIFERPVDSFTANGSLKSSKNRIDLYRRDCFVMEGKQTGLKIGSHGWNKAMEKAKSQAYNYIQSLSVEDGRPPFIIVVDVGRSIQIYSEFSCSGGIYSPFPDPTHYLIKLEDIEKPAIQRRLQALWLAPERLDSSKYAAKVTKDLSLKLAELAKSLEESGYAVERIAHFLKRCLFTMFSEDVELLPEDSYTNLLVRLKKTPEHFSNSMQCLWDKMNTGGFEGQLQTVLPRFNGNLFVDIDPIPLNSAQIQLLIDAAKADWRFVEPAIFGTLLERALDPKERHKLGAHYTPRAYVERLVMPTLIEPLRREWEIVKVSVEVLLQQGKDNKAEDALRVFHMHLCEIKILDPACGSANFLYVALEHLKRLEGEVLNYISSLSDGQAMLDTEGFTVDPHQFLGLEINPRAAAIAEVVLWIGFLQWHYRINGKLTLAEPILRDFKNIENRDALIEYDSREPLLDENDKPQTIWDGLSFTLSSTTGELIPDESGQKPIYQYQNARKTIWPEADYIIGNPPFIGSSVMRRTLGDGYVDAVRSTWKDFPESADFVMYWWNTAAELLRSQKVKGFGFITTNSIKQTFNRRIIQSHLMAKKPLSITYAIPDHPWVDNADGADVRISMTSAIFGEHSGSLHKVISEVQNQDDDFDLKFDKEIGIINSDLTCGVDVSGITPLKSNKNLSSKGVMIIGSGFIVTPDFLSDLDDTDKQHYQKVVKPYRNGRDIAQKGRNVLVIDFSGLSEEQARKEFPIAYQQVLEYVKPERDQNKEKSRRENWWLFGRKNTELRAALSGLDTYIATIETSKHRFFTSLDGSILPDNKLVNFALSDPYYLGILSSRLHVVWSFKTGSRLGVGNDPVYVKTTCFESFPFPDIPSEERINIANLAFEIDEYRKSIKVSHPDLAITTIYNVLEKIRGNVTLTQKDKDVNQRAHVSILLKLHDDLDKAVFTAYGWDDLGDILVGMAGATTPLPDKPKEQEKAEEELLTRLVELHIRRVSEESQNIVSWLRPDFQSPNNQSTATSFDEGRAVSTKVEKSIIKKSAWPKELRDQIMTLINLLSTPATVNVLVGNFNRNPIVAVNTVLEALEALGKAQKDGDVWSLM
jgi:hypothetical protein